MRVGLLVGLLLIGSVVTTPGPFGQAILAYYSGVGLSTVGTGGINGISLAFFNPTAMLSSTCDFTDPKTPCLRPAAGAGPSEGLKWALEAINTTASELSKNTAPTRGGKGTVFFAFGGQSAGGVAWDSIMGDAGKAKLFGQTCAQLIKTVSKTVGGSVNVGIDLDIEGTSTKLPNIGDFVTAFRGGAPYEEAPLMMESLSGLASPNSTDHYKVSIFQQYGPAQKGFTYLNMMVDNVAASCTLMSSFWRDPALDFLPPSSKVLGCWGVNLAAWILKNPGCTTGSDPLFPWMKGNDVGLGIWEWWSGPTDAITAVIDQIRA